MLSNSSVVYARQRFRKLPTAPLTVVLLIFFTFLVRLSGFVYLVEPEVTVCRPMSNCVQPWMRVKYESSFTRGCSTLRI